MKSYQIVDEFEKVIAEYAGAKYGVAVDSCCNALLLSCKYLKVKTVQIPKFTYPGVACAIINAGGKVTFRDTEWQGRYMLYPYNIYDSALRFRESMYVPDTLYCLSFHAKKHLPIGRGGMILTDDVEARDWLRKARFDGRNQVPLDKDKIDTVGFNCYLTPEQAARGLMLFDLFRHKFLDDIDSTKQGYPDLSLIEAYK